MSTVRPPAVAGAFYPDDPKELADTVDALLAAAPTVSGFSPIVIAPHAGYIYSGPIAAAAYRALDPTARRVLILGPTHRVAISGMALNGADYQRTPLGDIRSDRELTTQLEALPAVVTAPIVQAQEHSLEVHLPFLQRHLDPGFSVVPVAVGHADPDDVATVIEVALAHPGTAVVVSSDLSHYLPYEVGRQVDADTVAQIARQDPLLDPDQACGAYPINGLMCFARRHGLCAKILDVRSSGDTAGDRNAVVGYPAIAWYFESARPPRGRRHDTRQEDTELGNAVLKLAYDSIAHRLRQGVQTSSPPATLSTPVEAALSEPGATFVTLSLDGRLRGCIGSLSASRSLGEDVAANAAAAAFEDPRFAPLSSEELDRIDVEVSVLTPPVAMWSRDCPAPDEAEVVDRLRPGIDGVVIQFGPQRATYLPQVWTQIPDRAEFLRSLKVKAGLPRDFWDEGVVVETYRVREYSQAEGSLR